MSFKRFALIAVSFLFLNQAALAQNQSQALTHYLHANRLAKTGQHPEAIREYWAALNLSPNEPELQSMCRTALIAYKQLPDSATEKESIHQRIRQQAQEGISTIRQGNNYSANYHQNLASEVMTQAQRNASNTKNYYDDRHGHLRSKTDYAAKQAIIDSGIRQSAALVKDSQDHAVQAERRAHSLIETQANLEEQMHTPASSSGIQMTHKGTNLYVRNYVNYSPNTPLAADIVTLKVVTGKLKPTK
jgi:hypothetical protein